MSIFVRAANEAEVKKFQSSLSQWSKEKLGALEPTLGEKVKIVSCQCCDIYNIGVDTLIETRTTQKHTEPFKKSNLPATPNVAHGSFNIWSKSSPTLLKSDFLAGSVTEDIPGTEFYSPCKTCNERGNTDCQRCQQKGKEVCSSCDGHKRIDCPSCNGYGFFNCKDCNHTGMVEIDCSVCNKGDVSCRGCSGTGQYWSGGKYFDCRQCNGRGKATCMACGGRGSETVRCTTCNNGEIPCKTCRTQKTVLCQTCDPQGFVACADCRGRTVLDCKPCGTMGGFKTVEQLTYTTHIESNEILLSSLEKIKDKIRLKFMDGLSFHAPQLSLSDISMKVGQAELLGPLTEIFNHVSQNKPTTTLLEKVRVEKAIVLDVTFEYEGTKGHAFLEFNNGLLNVDINPLEGKVGKLRETLSADFLKAKNAMQLDVAKQIIKKAQDNKLADLAQSWKSQIDAIETRLSQEASAAFIRIKQPLIWSLGPLIWLLVGFFTPMSLTVLALFLVFTFLEAQKSSKDINKKKDLHVAELKKQMISMAGIFAVCAAVICGVNIYKTKSETARIYNSAAPLTEVK